MTLMQKIHFTKLVRFWGIVIILGITTSITTTDIITSYQNFNYHSNQLRQDYITRQKRIIRQEVNRTVDLILYEKAQSEKLTKDKIQAKVYEADAIARNIYQQNSSTKNRAEIQKMILDALRPVRFEGGSGYYFATGLNGVEILFADKPQMEGLNLLDMQDTRGQYVVKNMINIINQSDEGFYEYYWTKPDTKGNEFKKISFIKHFKPFNWFIGTGLYVEDVEKQIRKKLLSTISRIRFDKKGYIFINSLNGDALVANGKLLSGTKKLWQEFNSDPEQIKALFNKEYEAAQSENGTYIYYSFIKLGGSGKASPKTSFIRGIPDLQWLIGAGTYLDDIETDIAVLQSDLNRQIKNKILYFSLIALIIVCFFIFLFNRLHNSYKNNVELFISFFSRLNYSNEPIDQDQIQFDELNRMAKIANTMLANRKQTEAALYQSEAKFRELVESSSDLIWEVNRKGVYTYVSPQLEKILGYTPEEVIGKTPFDLMPEDEAKKISAIFPLLIKTKKPILNMESITSHKSKKQQIILESSGAPFFDEDGNIAGYRGISRDITLRKQTEKELRKLQKLKSIGTLAGGIAHDFNNMLAGLFGNIELAKLNISADHKAHLYIENAHQALQRATHLTNQLLTFAKGGDPILEAVNLQKIVKTSVTFNLSGSNIKTHFNLPSDLWQIKADKEQIDQVIANLTINAKHAMPNGGKLYITAKNVSKSQNPTCDDSQKAFVKLTFQDKGTGISKKHIERIFDPYFSTKQTGSGLGLATLHSIITRHKGYIKVDSEPDVGTTFTIFLPADNSLMKPSLSPHSRNTVEPKATKTHILVMDDEKMVRDISTEMLKSCGYSVDTAVDGEEALKKYIHAAKNDTPFDIVIMDLTIHGGMGGKETINRLLTIDPEAKAIVSSGYSTDPIMAKYKEYGFKGRVTKPFQIKDLKKAIFQVKSNC